MRQPVSTSGSLHDRPAAAARPWPGVACALACVIAFAAARPDVAVASTEPRSPPPPVSGAIAEPRLAGEGSLRWFGLKLYDARLWTGPAGLAQGRFASRPFALELRYSRAIDAQTIARASIEEIERLGFGDSLERESWLQAMRRVFPDVRAGDRLTGVNRPGQGVSFFHNDRPVGAVDDPRFATAFFSIWLDPRTVAPQLRAQLIDGLAAGDGGER